MDEVTGILIALGGLFAGLLALSWACGDFNPPKNSVTSDDPASQAPGLPGGLHKTGPTV